MIGVLVTVLMSLLAAGVCTLLWSHFEHAQGPSARRIATKHPGEKLDLAPAIARLRRRS